MERDKVTVKVPDLMAVDSSENLPDSEVKKSPKKFDRGEAANRKMHDVCGKVVAAYEEMLELLAGFKPYDGISDDIEFYEKRLATARKHQGFYLSKVDKLKAMIAQLQAALEKETTEPVETA